MYAGMPRSRAARASAAARLRLRQREYGVGGTARLEGAALLEVLALEVQLRTGLHVERRAREHGGEADLAGDALARFLDEVPGETWGVAGHGASAWHALRAGQAGFSAWRARQPRRGVGAHRAAPARP